MLEPLVASIHQYPSTEGGSNLYHAKEIQLLCLLDLHRIGAKHVGDWQRITWVESSHGITTTWVLMVQPVASPWTRLIRSYSMLFQGFPLVSYYHPDVFFSLPEPTRICVAHIASPSPCYYSIKALACCRSEIQGKSPPWQVSGFKLLLLPHKPAALSNTMDAVPRKSIKKKKLKR